MKTDYQVVRVASSSPTRGGHGISNFEPGERKKSSKDQKMTTSAESQEIKFKNDMIHL